MSVLCPYCGLTIELTGVKPGRFSPRCPKCREKFVLIIPQDTNRPPEVLAIKTASQTHILPAMRGDEQVTLEESSPAPAAPAPARAAAVTHPPDSDAMADEGARRPSRHQVTAADLPAGSAGVGGNNGGTGRRIVPSPAELTAPPADTSIFASKRGKYADWDDVESAPADAPLATLAAARDEPATAEPAPPDSAHADVPPKAPSADPGLSGTLGGYEIQHKLGAGGMGAVYLARQMSLDRNVALKVLLPQFSTDPQFVARFTREAYAAAQLTHHNVVQIHDIGADYPRAARESNGQEVHFFSMELVEGQSLADLVKAEGRQDPEVAAGYILQAARGLKFAHDHGMIHRDIKPDNLLLNKQGIVKVADLGLVKTPGTTETRAADGGRTRPSRSAMRSRLASQVTEASAVFGTPAFMAPEQCEDATRVDRRADIYSLGCTLYFLLTGNPPFGGRTAAEVMTKQVREPVVPPDVVCRHVPPELSQIVLKMMAKRPEDRYADMDEVIDDLEAYLGVESHGPFTPREEHVRLLEAAVDQFYQSTSARLRGHLIAGFFTLCAVGLVFSAFLGSLSWASGFVALAVFTSLVYFTISGINDKTFLFAKVKQVASAMPLGEWVKACLGIGLLLAAVVVLGWHWIWLGMAVVSLLAAITFHAMIDGSVRRQRSVPLRRVEEMLRHMRLRGLEEGAIRQFVCKYAGERWEEFFENLFGYEAKMEARQRWGRGDRGLARRRFRAWRDPIIRWAEETERQRKEERDRRHIQSVEVRALEAAGLDMVEARRQGKRRAQRIVEAAAMVRETAMRHAATLAPDAAPPPQQVHLVRALVSEDEPPDVGRVRREHESYITRRYGGPLDILLGGTMRFVLAAILLVGFLSWRYQNNDLARLTRPTEEVVSAQRQDAVDMARGVVTRAVEITRASLDRPGLEKRLDLPLVPELLEMLLSSWGAGVAGLILLASIFFRGKVFGLMALGAAAVAVLGPYFTIADVDPRVRDQFAEAIGQTETMVQQANLTATTLSMAVAAGMFIVAVVFLRDKEPA